MPDAIFLRRFGGAGELQLEQYDPGKPGPGQIRLVQRASGVNFLDIYHRAGTHHSNLQLPAIPGVEAIGIVDAIGDGVGGFREGSRVAYPLTPGSYSEIRLISSDDCIAIPAGISDEVIAGTFMKGLTVAHLLNNLAKIKAGDTLLCHAAAGGVGLIACQWSKHLGATVIGTVGDRKKFDVALAHGCDHCIDYNNEDVAERVDAITGGNLCSAVLDGVGRNTWIDSLKSLRPGGVCVSYGLASGPLPQFGFSDIPAEGFITRATVRSVTQDRQELERTAKVYFEALQMKAFIPHIERVYPLKDAGAAHEALESRKTIGSLVLSIGK